MADLTLGDLKKRVEERGYATDEEYYQRIMLQNGPPTHVVFPEEAVIESYRGRVPDVLLRFWRERGWGSWLDGKFWICVPEFFQPVLEAVLEGDPEYNARDFVIFGYNGFGEMHLYMPENYYMRIDLSSAYASINNYSGKTRPTKSSGDLPKTNDTNMIWQLMEDISAYYRIWEDESQRDLLPLAIEKCGSLDTGEIYGFAPALSIGGQLRIEDVQKFKAIEHMMFLLQLERPTLYRHKMPKDGGEGFGSLVPVRKLGPQ